MPDIRTVIVDDQDDVRLLMRMVMEAAPIGICVDDVASGAEVLDLLEHHRPDAVVLDLMMPGMDGIETARRIRARHPDQKILFCSAHLDDQFGSDAEALRDEACLSKDDVIDLPGRLVELIAS